MASARSFIVHPDFQQGANDTIVVRIDDPSGTPLACGRVDPGTPYSLQPPGVTDRQNVFVRIFARPSLAETPRWTELAAARLVEIELAERDLDTLVAIVSEVAPDLAPRADPNDRLCGYAHVESSARPTWASDALAYARTISNSARSLPAAFGARAEVEAILPREHASELVETTRRELLAFRVSRVEERIRATQAAGDLDNAEADGLLAILQSLGLAAGQATAQARQPHVDAALARWSELAGLPSSNERNAALSEIGSRLGDLDTKCRQVSSDQGRTLCQGLAAGLTELERLLVNPAGTRTAIENQVAGILTQMRRVIDERRTLAALHAWMILPATTLRPIVAHELPVAARSVVRTIAFEREPSEVDDVPVGAPISLLLTGVPSDAGALTLHSTRGRRQREQVSESVVGLFSIALEFVGDIVRAQLVDGFRVLSVVGEQQPATQRQCARAGAIRTVAEQQVRTFDLESLDAEHQLDLLVCEGGDCTDANHGERIRARARVSTPEPTFRGGALLLELGAAAFGQDNSFGPSRYTAVTAVEGGSQEFQLGYGPRTNLFTVGLFPGFRVSRAVVASGPSLVIGGNRDVRMQWDLRAGVEVAAGLYLTAGFGVRRVPEVQFDHVGNRRTAVVGADGRTTAPIVFTEDRWSFVGVVGVALDLGAAGSAAAGLIKTARASAHGDD